MDFSALRGRRVRATMAVLAAALLLAAGFSAGISLGRSSPASGGTALVEPLTGSGPIGPWQRYGHAASGDKAARAVAADPEGILLIGDSVAARIQDRLGVALRKKSWPMSWDHWNGRPTHATADALLALDTAGAQPARLVVVSGENDVFEPYLFETQIERIMRIAGPRRQVHWVTPVVRRPAFTQPDQANSDRLRLALASAAQRHPNLYLVDWAQLVVTVSEAEARQLLPDGVHPSPAGIAQMVDLIMTSLESHPLQMDTATAG